MADQLSRGDSANLVAEARRMQAQIVGGGLRSAFRFIASARFNPFVGRPVHGERHVPAAAFDSHRSYVGAG